MGQKNGVRTRSLDIGLLVFLLSHVGYSRAADFNYPLAIAYSCLSSIAQYSNKGIGDKDGDLRNAISKGNQLISKVISLSGDGKLLGWGYRTDVTARSKACGVPGALDAFGDGTCNPPDTPYMIQTGYAVSCLAQLHVITGEGKYLDLAKRVIFDSWNIGTVPPGCKDCFYYWYSYHSNDEDRYVRNTNLIMGLGVVWMYAATGSAAYRDRALAIARAEHREIRSGNYGYLGIDDRRYRASPATEEQRIENHIPHQVKALKDIGSILGDTQATNDAKTMLDAFLNCSNDRCRPNNCRAWAAPPSCKATATIAPCILAELGEQYRTRCSSVVRELSRLNDFQIFLYYSPSNAATLKRDERPN